jgi:Mg-chelatase subunit ChlD
MLQGRTVVQMTRSMCLRIFSLVVLTLCVTVPLRTSAQSDVSIALAGLTAEDWSTAQAVVTVAQDGQPVDGLTAESFQVNIDGRDVEVASVTRAVDASLPINVVLALDVSDSMRFGALDFAKQAAHRFLEGLGAQDSAAVLVFSDQVSVVQPFTQDRALLGAAIDGLTAGGFTSLYDASIQSAQMASDGGSARRAVVLLSDGYDNASVATREAALSATDALDVPTFVIGLGTEIEAPFFTELVRATGGRFTQTPSAEGLTQLYEDVSELLRGQYIVTIDASALGLGPAEAIDIVIRVDTPAGEALLEQTVCPVDLCASFVGLETGAQISDPRVLTAEVVANEPVQSVTLLIDGAEVDSAATPPYEFTFDPDDFADGEHVIALSVRTAGGEVTTAELSVRAGAASGGLSFLVIGVLGLLVAFAVIALVLLLRRRRSPRSPAPSPEPGPDTEPSTQRPAPLLGFKKSRRGLLEQAATAAPAIAGPTLGYLTATAGPLTGQTFEVGAKPVRIGSGHRAEIRLPAEPSNGVQVASEHIRVWIRDGHLMLHELKRLTVLGSEGGAWAFLSDGESFQLGASVFTFSLQAPVAASTTPEPVPNVLRDRSETAPSVETSGEPSLPEQIEPPSPIDIYRDRPVSTEDGTPGETPGQRAG